MHLPQGLVLSFQHVNSLVEDLLSSLVLIDPIVGMCETSTLENEISNVTPFWGHQEPRDGQAGCSRFRPLRRVFFHPKITCRQVLE